MAFNLSNVSFSWEELDRICGCSQEEVSFSDFERLPHSTPIHQTSFGNPEKRTTKKRLVFEDSIDTASDNGGSQSVDIKNEEMLGNPLDDTLQELAKQEIEKLMPEDSQKKCLKIYLLHKALVAVTPTLLKEFSSCLALQSNLYYQGISTNPFCKDLLNFLTSRTEENEQKLLSHNHSLVLPKSL